MSISRVCELIDGVGLPKGVVNLVHGDRRVSEALLADPQVAGIAFVGSSAMARQVAQGCVEQGRRYQALGPVKNYLVVMPDAEMEHTLANTLTSCFGWGGRAAARMKNESLG